jgi:outer membrane receptor protein involved in Fe transport
MNSDMNKQLFLSLVASIFIVLNLNAQITDTTMARIYSMSLEELMNTKVAIATKTDQRLSETPSIVSVITTEDIKNMGARELTDVLQTIPGFELLKKFDGEYGIGIRGVKDPRCTSKLLIMIDGIPYNQVLYGYSIYYGYEINMDAIERIEIIRGPGSALYGRNAFSGVINIITKTAKTGEKIMIKGSIGSYNTKSVSGYYGFNNNKINASISVSRIYTDGTNVKYDDGFGGKSLWSINHDNSSIITNIGIGKLNFSGSFYSLNDGGFVDVFLMNEKRGYYSLSYENQISPRISYTTRIYGHYLNHVEHYQQLKPGIASEYPLGIYYQPQGKEYSYCLEADLKIKLFSNNDLLVGIQPEFYGVNDVIIYTNYNFPDGTAIPGIGKDNLVLYKPGWVSNDGHDYNNTAILFQDIWYPFKNLSLTLGGRFDFDSEIGGVFNPRAGLYWAPFKKISFKLLYGQAYRAPSPTEQYGTLGFAIGNETLKPERIKTIEFAFTYRLEKMTNSVSIFRNQLTNMIYAASKTALDPTNIYKNIGKNASTGIEYETKLILVKGLSSYLNYSYTFSENTDNIDGQDTVYNETDVAPHKLNFGVNYSFLKHFNLNMNLFYRSKMGKLLAPDSSGTLVEVQDPIGNFAILNSTFQVNNIFKNLNLSFSVHNLLNTKYYSQENQYLHEPPQPGRQLIFSAIYKF